MYESYTYDLNIDKIHIFYNFTYKYTNIQKYNGDAFMVVTTIKINKELQQQLKLKIAEIGQQKLEIEENKPVQR